MKHLRSRGISKIITRMTMILSRVLVPAMNPPQRGVFLLAPLAFSNNSKSFRPLTYDVLPESPRE
jgi:hypothetical protein